MMDNKQYQIVLFGATGFTGTLVAEYLHKHYGGDLNWALAGRNQDKLERLSQKVGNVPILIVDVGQPDSLQKMASQAQVVCSTVGPYSLYGSQVVAACVDHGCHYCDLTGEVPWIRSMIDLHHQKAQDKKLKIVHCCGFDAIPSDMGVYFVQQQVKQATGNYCQNISMRVKGTRGGISGGTYASMKAVVAAAKNDPDIGKLLQNPYSLNPDENFKGPDKIDYMGVGFDPHYQAHTAPFVMASINTRVVRRSHALNNFEYGQDFCYDEAMLTGKGLLAKMKARVLTRIIKEMSSTKKGIFKNLADRFMPESGEGPSPKQREQGFFNLGMVGTTADNQLFRAKITGDRDPGYGSTAKMLGESAVCLAQDNLPHSYGVITPSTAMGDMLLNRLQKNAGLKFIMLPVTAL